jgi:DNA-binding transcriptional ArsR family regulator
MSSPHSLTFSLDRRLLEHPRAYHLRRMRQGVWLFLDLLARLPAGAESIEVEPGVVGEEMGLPEATVRSWLGHLRRAGYVEALRLNGKVRVTIRKGFVPEPAAPIKQRFFTVAKLQRALGDRQNAEAYEAALKLHADPVIRKALARTLAVPDEQIRRSRTALFFYLLKASHP